MRFRRPPIVTHLKRSPLGHAAKVHGAPPDRTIRAWNDAREESPSKVTTLQQAITREMARIKQANDDAVIRAAAEQVVNQEQSERAIAHFRIIEGDRPHIEFYPEDPKAGWRKLKEAIGRQFHRTKKVVTDARHPGNLPWHLHIKDTRKDQE